MVMSFWKNPEKVDIKKMIGYMDKIDQLRNDLLSILNSLLRIIGAEEFKTIKLSSEVINERRIGGSEEIAPYI